MASAWTVIALLALGTIVIKAAGPALRGARDMPLLTHTLTLLVPALLAALILEQTFGRGQGLVLDARAVGLIVALAALALRLSLIWVLMLAAASTALVRLLG